MSKPLQIGLLVGVIALSLGLMTFLYVRSSSPGDGNWTDEQRTLANALEKAGGDPNKLDPATKARLEATVAKSAMSTGSRYQTGGGSAMPMNYPTPTSAGR